GLLRPVGRERLVGDPAEQDGVLGAHQRPDGLPELGGEVRAHPLLGAVGDAIERGHDARYDLPHGGLPPLWPASWSGLLLTLRTGTGQMDTTAEKFSGGRRCAS